MLAKCCFVRIIVVYGVFLLFLSCGAKQTTYCADSAESSCDVESRRLATTSDIVPPVFGGEILLSDINATSATISWSRASDAVTVQAELEYRVVYVLESFSLVAETFLLSTLPSGAVIAKDWSGDLISTSVMSLKPETSYQVAVIVRDSEANLALLGPKTFITMQVKPSTIGGDITFSAIKSSILILTWGVRQICLRRIRPCSNTR